MEAWVYHLASLVVFLTLLVAIAISNLGALRALDSYPPVHRFPSVSILVPARNEAGNIGPCLRSLLAQDYPNFELLVLDVHSTDATAAILAAIYREAPQASNFHIYHGEALPAGWLGKTWACHQLAQKARGELLLFTDADTRHHPLALRDAVSALSVEGADMLAVLPREETHTWGEKLVVPLILWSIFAFLPIRLARRLNWTYLAAAVGQFMLLRRSAYDQVGGFAAVRSNPADDLALARRVVTAGLRLRLVDAGRRVRCRMYRDFRESFAGLSRTLFAAFDYKIGLFALAWISILILFLEPLGLLGFRLAGLPVPDDLTRLAFLGVSLALLLWGIFCKRFNYPVYLAWLYPVVILLSGTIAARSIYLTLRGKIYWKGRQLPPIKS